MMAENLTQGAQKIFLKVLFNKIKADVAAEQTHRTEGENRAWKEPGQAYDIQNTLLT